MKMADFINFEANVESDYIEEVDFVNSEHDDEVSNISDSDSLKSFIDNEEVKMDVNFYRHFNNIETDIEQTLEDAYNEALHDVEKFDEISNLCESSEEEFEIEDFKNSKENIKKFHENLFPKANIEQQKEHNQFVRAILYAIRFDKINEKEICEKKDFEKSIDKKLIEQLDQPEKFQFIVDLQKFNNICYEINSILSKHDYFLKVFELKNKFRHLSMKEPKKQNIVRQLSSCLMEKYNGFQVISIEYARKQRKKFKPINIIYKPTKHIEIEPLCYFSDDISKAYTNLYSKPNQMKRANKSYQCYYCNKFFIRSDKHQSHINNCSGAPGVVYNFNNQNLISYQDNFHAKADIPFVIFFDYETTASTDNSFDPEQKKVFVVSYVMIVVFHPELKLNCIVI